MFVLGSVCRYLIAFTFTGLYKLLMIVARCLALSSLQGGRGPTGQPRSNLKPHLFGPWSLGFDLVISKSTMIHELRINLARQEVVGGTGPPKRHTSRLPKDTHIGAI